MKNWLKQTVEQFLKLPEHEIIVIVCDTQNRTSWTEQKEFLEKYQKGVVGR
jgi:hypothetical protein